MLNNRKNRAEIAKETVSVCKKGEYKVGNKTCNLSWTALTKFYSVEDISGIDIPKLHSKEAVVSVVNESVVDTVWNSSVEDIRLGVLNFASAYHPGGGFLNGSMAQEEAIAYCSDLYLKLTERTATKFYDMGRECNTKAHTDNMMYSNVNFIRDSEFKFREPKEVGVITCAAINKGAMINNGESIVECNTIMKDRMRNILILFMYFAKESVVLGAFGCGVFQNNNEDIARIWKELLYDEGYIYCFKEVTFSVLEDRNNSYTVFNRVLG